MTTNNKVKSATLQCIADIATNDKVIVRHVLRDTWMPGPSAKTCPVTLCISRGEVVIQLATRRNVFTGTIRRVVRESNGLVSGGWFTRNDGSRPSTITLVAGRSAMVR